MLITKSKQATGGTGPALADWHLDSTWIFVAPNTKLTRSAGFLEGERVGRKRVMEWALAPLRLPHGHGMAELISTG